MHRLAVNEEPQLGVAHGSPADRLGPRGQTLPDKGKNVRVGHEWTTEPDWILCDLRLEHVDCGAGFLEEAAVGRLQIALSRQIVCNQNVMALEFDMPVAYLVDLNPCDRRAIDKDSGRNQNFTDEIDADRMRRRNAKILRGPVR